MTGQSIHWAFQVANNPDYDMDAALLDRARFDPVINAGLALRERNVPRDRVLAAIALVLSEEVSTLRRELLRLHRKGVQVKVPERARPEVVK